MRNDGPYIEIKHSGDRYSAEAIAPVYDIDQGPLRMPAHIHITGIGHDGMKIGCYANQVEEYDIWLEDQIKANNQKVMFELDTIFNKAIKTGVIIITRCCPEPYITHAHVVKNLIMRLAG